MTDLSAHQSDGLWEETVLVSGCYGAQCSASPTTWEKLEQAVCRE